MAQLFFMVPDFSKQIQKTMNKVSYIFTTQPPQIPRGYMSSSMALRWGGVKAIRARTGVAGLKAPFKKYGIFFPTEKTLNRSGIPSDMPLIQMGTVAQCNAVVAS